MNPSLVILACLALAGPLVACGAESSPPADTATDWRSFRPADPERPLVDRFVEASRLLLGTPYENGPLGEGSADAIDPDPRVDFSRVDCVTYLEQALALALAPAGADEAALLGILDAIRYEDGAVEFVRRNHYMVADWIPANGGLLADVTAEVGGDRARTVRRTIDRAAFLREHGAEPRPERDHAREIELTYLPTEALAAVEDRLETGDLVFWVGRAETIFVVHTGLVVRDADGILRFRHGSSRAGKVLDEPLADYAAAAGFAIGFLVVRLHDEEA